MANKNIKKLLLKKAGDTLVADIENIENRISQNSSNLETAKQELSNKCDTVLSEAKAYTDTEKAKYLPLTGGSITGNIQHRVSQADFYIQSGADNQGASLTLCPVDSTKSDLQGAFILGSKEGSTNYFLVGKNDGCLYWRNSQVMTVGVGTTVTGVNNFSNGLQINGHSVTIG